MPRITLTLTLIGLVLVTACAPAAPTTRSGDTAGSSAPAASSGRSKTLTVAVQRELKGFARFTGVAAGGGSPGAGNNHISKIGHNYLAVESENNGTFIPQLAFEIPSIARGTWVVNADGTSETTWKLRPGIKWHDGTPFTAEDLVFGSTLFRDTEYPVPPTERIKQIRSTSAPDPQTFVIRWASTVASAAEPTDLDPLPRHLLEEMYRTEKQNILTTNLLSSEFVGLGPYRLARWVEGVEIELVRFDDYYLGRPPFDRVVVKYIADANTMVANVLAGNADVVLAPGPNLDVASELKQRWIGTGNQVLTSQTGSQQFLRPQFQPEFASPRNGGPILAVRKAMYTSVDRQSVADVASAGLAPTADSWVPPTDPWRKQLEPFIAQYPYDPNRALQLFAEAGWVRGGDGTLVHQPSGERFESKIVARPTSGADKILAVMADTWKGVGVQMAIEVLPPALASDRRTMGTQPFGVISSFPSALNSLPPIHSSLLANDANRWTGTNFQGYSNPRVDGLLDRILVTIDEREQLNLHSQLVKEAFDDVALIPLFWQVEPVLIAKGVSGVTYNGTSDFFQWNKQ